MAVLFGIKATDRVKSFLFRFIAVPAKWVRTARQYKTSKIINDMAKVQIKSEKITAFGGIFFVLDKFDSILSSVIDSHLGLRNIHGDGSFVITAR